LAHDVQLNLSPADSRRLEGLAWPLFAGCLIAGVAGLVLALIVSLFLERGMARFGHAYLAAFAFVLSLSLGGLFFTMVTHLFRAGWCVLIRRVTEVFAAAVPVLAILSLPLFVYVIAWDGALYPWAQSFHHDDAPAAAAAAAASPDGQADGGAELVLVINDPAADHAGGHDHDHGHGHGKNFLQVGETMLVDGPTLEYMVDKRGVWYAGWFWALRVIGYFAVWTLLGLWFWRTSTRQDLTGDATLTRKMEKMSAPGLIFFGLTITFASFDLFKSLDPTWFSTMFGIYYFAGTFQATMAALILVVMGLQAKGFLPSVTKEHYHDMGKLMYAFVVFWAYIMFSQYLLIWYAAIPAEQPFLIVRGMSTGTGHETPWSAVVVLLLFARFVIPFLGLMSRHIKRNRKMLAFWAVWLLVIHAVEMFWLVLPSFDANRVPVPIVEVLCLVGVLGLFGAAVVGVAAKNSLVSIGDPRVPEALALRNI
jgi:hypothetical protein